MSTLTNIGNKTLLKFRLTVYFVAYAHLIIMSVVLFGKNFEKSDDENVRMYAKLKWKLLTAWFNILMTAYIPLCLYCDWQELRYGDSRNLNVLRRIKDFLFSSLILPSTYFGDILFWQLWHRDRRFLMPLSVDEFIGVWEQHSMHTASFVFVTFDLIFVRRKRPKSMTPGITVMLIFITAYVYTCLQNMVNGVYIYPLLRILSPYKVVVLSIYMYTSYLFYYTSQWLVVDLIYGLNKK